MERGWNEVQSLEGVSVHPNPCSSALRSRGSLGRASQSLELRLCSVPVPVDEDEPWGGAEEPFPVGQRVIHCHRTMSRVTIVPLLRGTIGITFPGGPGSHAGQGEMNPCTEHRESPGRGTKMRFSMAEGWRMAPGWNGRSTQPTLCAHRFLSTSKGKAGGKGGRQRGFWWEPGVCDSPWMCLGCGQRCEDALAGALGGFRRQWLGGEGKGK